MATKIGTLADNLLKVRDERDALQEKLKKVREKYNEAEKKLYNEMKKQDTDRAGGSKANASITYSVKASVTDFGKLFAYVKRYNAVDLLSRSVNSKAYNERVADGKKIPGVESFRKISINLRRK